MKLCVFTVPYGNLTLEETAKVLSKKGVQALEIGAGGYPGNAHLNAKELLSDDTKIQEVLSIMTKYNMTIAAVSCHGNPLHPQLAIAKDFHNQFVDAVLLAEKLGVDTVVTFSGCPGDHAGAMYPNWVTCAWPEDFRKILEYQWNDVLIPYWKETVEFCRAHGVNKVALEMHPGFAVYNPATLIRLREAVGEVIGANFDPSHLYWQGIKPSSAIKTLGRAIYHFHAKDTKIDQRNTDVNGVLDTTNYGNSLERSWIFRTVGYGHGKEEWNEIISTLKAIGYEGAISIEHEDALMSVSEGMIKAIDFLKETIIYESLDQIWWE